MSAAGARISPGGAADTPSRPICPVTAGPANARQARQARQARPGRPRPAREQLRPARRSAVCVQYIGGVANPRDIVSVERVIHAPATAIFDIIADPARHPEIDGSGTVLRARPGAPSRLCRGATFGMDMKRGLPYRMISTVTEFGDGRLIAWAPRLASGRAAWLTGRVWRYELEPVDGGTRVRETWDISREALRFGLRYVAASRTGQDMAKSLERLDRLATSEA